MRTLAAALLGGVSLGTLAASAQNATWQAVPTVAGPIAATFDFNANANWTPAAVPTGTASFGATTGPSLSFSAASTVLGGFTFNAAAPAYSFQLASACGVCIVPNLTLTGAGVVNNAASVPTFSVFLGSKLAFQNASTAANSNIVMHLGSLDFQNTSTAGNAIITMPDSFHPGFIKFHNTSSAGNASFTLSETSGAQIPAELIFLDQSTAANSTIVLNPGVGVGGANAEFGIFGGTDTPNAGTAHITVNDQSRASFFASSSAANATIVINGGLVDFRDQSTAANATITVNANGELFVGEQATLGNANITNSNGGLVQFGSGFGFGDTATAGNSTIVNNSGGLIQFYDNTTAGNATITTNSGASTQFFLSSTGGNAKFITNAGGTFDMSGLTAAGMTAGSIEGAGNYLLGAKTLTVGSNNLSTEVSGVISGVGGALTKVGTGTLTLSGNNHYSGSTTVNAGTLLVNGSISFSNGLTVNAGGTVGGSGALPKTTINGGTLSPGNSIGTINIAGGLTFVGAGNYLVEVSPSAADKTNVTGAPGTASLAGTLSAVGTGGNYAAGTKYTVLNATGGVSGTFGSLAISGSFGGTKPHIEYDANNVYLVLDPNALPLTGLTPNQRAVASAVNTALQSGMPAPAPFTALFGLTAAQLPGALDQLSGEVHPSTASVLLDESLYARSAILGRLRQASYGGNNAEMASLASGGPMAYAGGEDLAALAYAKSPIVTKAPPMASQPGYDVVFWAQGFGGWGRFDTDNNAAAVRRDLAGFFSGVDTRVGTNGRLGIAAGYTGSRNALDGRGSSTVETGHLAGYGSWSFGNFNLRAGGDYAWHTIDTSRTAVFPGFFDTDTAHYNGTTGQIFGEAGYGFAFGKVAVEPFAGAAWVRLQTDGFNERSGAAALSAAANSFETGYSTLGIRAATTIPLGYDMMLVPRAAAAWQHAFNAVTPADTLAFQAAAVPFVIAGVPIARDALLAEAGLDLAIGRSTIVGISYVGQIANNVHDHAAKGKFSWKF